MVDVKENLEGNSATITSYKTENEVLVIKDPVFPSLYILKWKTGVSPKEFDAKFTSKEDAMKYGAAYVEKMRWTQAAKNEVTRKKYAKKKSVKE